jgi:RHS repeat-associated protein
MLYFGDGSSRSVRASLVDNDTHYMAASEEGAEVYLFDLSGKHLETQNGLTGAVLYQFGYDNQNRLQSITDAYAHHTRIERDASDNLTGIRAPFGQVTRLTLGPDGYLASIENPNGETHAITYYAGGLLQTFTTPRGQVSTFTYDGHGLLIQDASSGGKSLSFVTNSQDPTTGERSTQMSTALGRTSSLTLAQTATGMRRTETDPQGVKRTVSTDYNQRMTSRWADTTMQERYQPDARLKAMANFTASRNIRTNTSSFSQNAWQTVTPNTPPSPFDYTSLKTQIETNGKRTDVVYTRSTGETVVTTPGGRKLYTTSDPLGKLTRTQLASYAPVHYEYDSHGRLVTVAQETRTTTIAYNAEGYVDAITNALGLTTRFTYDNAGRVLTRTLPDLRVIRYAWDANGNLTRLTPPGKHTHRFTWNLFDLPRSYVPPAFGDALTVNTVYLYNKDAQLTRILRPDGNTITFQYDGTGGQLTSIAVPHGTYTYTYANGLVHTAQSPDGITNTLMYAGTQVIQDEVMKASGASAGFIHFNYNNDFLVSRSEVASRVVDFVYDDDNLLLRAGNQQYTRDPQSGFLTETTLGKLTETYDYDATYGELRSFVATHTAPTGEATVLFQQSLTRDAMGRIIGKTETVGGTTTTYAYTYDQAGRLTDVQHNGALYSHYAYDTNSNRRSGKAGGAAFRATYDAQDRLATYNTLAYTYTLNGELASKTNTATNQTTTYTYDVLGNLTQVVLPTKTVSYVVDGLNRRQARAVGGTMRVQYLYEDQLRIGAVLNAAGGMTHRFIYGAKPHVPDYMIKGGKEYKLISDAIGSVRLVVNSATGAVAQQLDYDEFGKVLTDTNPGFQPFGFAGCLYDPDTKLCRFGARDYDAQTGRWLSKDPILFGGGDTNLYGYVINDPVNLIDPRGLSQADVDNAVNWLKANHPELFNGINPTITDTSLPFDITGITLTSNRIFVDSSKTPLMKDNVDNVAHELMHAQVGNVLKNMWANIFHNNHSKIYHTAAKIGGEYWLQQNRNNSCKRR